MKKFNVDATEQNVLNALENDVLYRSNDVKDFIQMLETIDYNAFISLDAPWGEGKTFLVRQVEMTLRYHNKKSFQKEISEAEIAAFSANKVLKDLQLEKTYLPIYYNAWLYDNHSNALMSLIMAMIKNCETFVDTKLSSDKGEVLTSILDSIQFWKSNNWNQLRECVTGKDILSEALLLEEVRDKIKIIFDDILVEHGEKLVIFIDELDRCKPTFALEILESIKHYFDDDRIIFILSVNKSQLIHTISNYYGTNFDSSGYLNKFFDINIQLPKADANMYFQRIGIFCDDFHLIKKAANELQSFYKLSLRDTSSYFQKINLICEKGLNRYGMGTLKLLIIFVPILCILEIKDIEKRKQIFEGQAFNELKAIIDNSETLRTQVSYLGKTNNIDIEVAYKEGLIELEKMYLFAFRKNSSDVWYRGRLEITSNFDQTCLRVCNTV